MDIMHGDASRRAKVLPTCHPTRYRDHMYGRRIHTNEHVVPSASRGDEHASDPMAYYTGRF